MTDDKIVIVSAKRTAIGSFQGNLSSIKATKSFQTNWWIEIIEWKPW